MAEHTDHPETLAVPVLAYPVLRPLLQSGDLLFLAGTALISHAIQTVTGSPWSHLGIILRLPDIDRVLLYESVDNYGVRLSPLSSYLLNFQNTKAAYRGPCVLARFDPCPASMQKGLTSFGADNLGRSYDREEILEILGRRLSGQGRPTRHSGYICSEIVEAWCEAEGLTLVCHKKGYRTPEDIWQEPTLQPYARLLPAQHKFPQL